jgi:hypothetical protein
MNVHKNARLTPSGRERIVPQVESGQATEAIAKAVGRTGKQIAAESGVVPATVSRVLRRLGLNKLSALAPAEPVRPYERETQVSPATSTSKSSAVSAP